MRIAAVCAAALLAGLVSVPNLSTAAPLAPERQPSVSGTIPVQGYREHCRYLRHRLRELEAQRAYAPPWEQRRIDRRVWRTREELRRSGCRW